MSCLHITVTHVCVVSIFLSYGSPCLLHVLLFHVPVFMLYDWFLLQWYGYSRYWTWELLICYMWTSTSIVHVSRYIVHVILFPFLVILFYAINRTLVQLSCYPYHVLYLFLLHRILDISDHNDNLGMGETWRLTRSYRVDVWIHCLSHCRGRGSAGYRLL